KQNSVSAEIDEQGNYSATIPVGDVQVSVDNRELEPRPSMPSGGLPAGLPPEVAKKLASVGAAKAEPKSAESGPPRPSGRYKKIPEKYYQVETSGLDFKVTGGDQKHDLELKD